MAVGLFSKGALLGLALAVPLGPIGALCINRALNRGFVAGVAGGLGTAVADAAYAALAAFGFVAFAATLALVATPAAVVGGLFLLWLGFKFVTSEPPKPNATASRGDLTKTISTTFLLTIGNPATILTAAALFAGLGLAGALDRTSAIVLVAGVFAGSMAWWIVLSAGVTLARHKLPKSFSAWVTRASGVMIAGFGLLSIWSVMSG
jgi:putative LysE/RhtB family amino acid efflux pump